MGGTPVEYRSPPPLLGEHTESVLTELANVSSESLAELRKRKVI
jgi:crotonobetainyl-CoA:carnitine CoA-transferase CaiB-like acyl-CoA transferase